MTTLAEVLREQRNRQDAREEGAVQRVTSIYDGLQADLEQRLFTVNTLIADAQRTGEPTKRGRSPGHRAAPAARGI